MMSKQKKEMSSKSKLRGKLSSSSSVIESQQGRISELESLLAERDEVITNLQKKLVEQGELHNSSMKKFRRERDELRTKNATLVSRLAEVSRKRSLTTNTPPLPRPGRSRSVRDFNSRLPSIPSGFATSPQQYPHTLSHHNSSSTLPAPRASPPTKNTHPTKTISFAVPVTNQEDSDTDYSDLEDDETKAKPAAKKMSSSENGDNQKEFTAVMDSSAVSASPVLVAYNRKSEEVGLEVQQPSISLPISCERRRQNNSAGSSVSSNSSTEGREASYTINITGDKSSPSQKRASPAQQWSPKVNARAAQLSSKKFSSSDGVASAIQELLNKKGSSNGSKKESDKSPMMVSSRGGVSTRAQNGYSSCHVDKREPKTLLESDSRQDIALASEREATPPPPKADVKTVLKSELEPDTKEDSKPGPELKGETNTDESTTTRRQKMKGGVAKTRALFEKMSSNPSIDVPPFRKDRTESVSSDFLSSEGTGTDWESSLDVISPPLTNPGPTHLVTDKPIPTHLSTDNPSPTHPVTDNPSPAHVTAEKSLKSSNASMPNIMLDKTKRMFNSAHHMSVRDDSNLLEEDEEEDSLGDIHSFGAQDMRSRTMTVSGATYKKMEIGRKKIKVHRKENMILKRATSQVVGNGKDFTKDVVAIKHDFELLSPLLEAKIKNMALTRIYDMYGGKDTVKSAISVIEQAWQNYRLRKRFLERLKEKSQNRMKIRERAKSLRQPHRRPSILQKGGRGHYRKVNLVAGDGKTTPAAPVMMDPMARSREKAALLGKERLGHTHSGARLELMEKRRSDVGVIPEKEKRRSTTKDRKLTGDSQEGVEVREGTPMEDSVFAEEEKAEEKKMMKTLGPALSVTQIEMQFDSIGMEQCRDGNSQHPKFDLALSNLSKMEMHSEEEEEEGEDELQDSLQPDGITLSLSTSDFQRPVSVFSETSMESSVSVPAYPVTKSERRGSTLPRPGRTRQVSDIEREKNTRLKVGIYHFNRKPTKGIQYLVRNNLLEDDPKSVSEFLVSQKGLSKEKIGEFLGAINSEFNMAVLESLVEHVYIGDKPIDEALREFQRLFRMPGEAQKIDKIMEVFALEYYKRNKSVGVFKNEDGAYILSFSIMMLHTSLHNPSVKLRTSKKQWLTMNRGTNDGDNFPDPFLLEIFERIHGDAFITGQDHTHVVAELEKQIIGSPIENLRTTQRYLVYKCTVTEVQDLGVRHGFRNRHKRQLFLLNDIAIVCKKKHQDQFIFKETFSLPNLVYIKFEASTYKYGIQLHAVDRETPFQFNCDSHAERELILQHLDDILHHLKVLESERIAELGSTLTTKGMDMSRAISQTCNAGDLITPMSLSLDESAMKKKKANRGDYVDGVGDLAVHSLPASLSHQYSVNRISQDSGFISQQLTPTPPLSPAPTFSSDNETNNSSSYAAGSNTSPRSTTPNAPRTSSTMKPNGSSLSPSPRPSRSKSTDGIHRLGVATAPRSPSMEFPGKRRSSAQTNSNSNSPLVESKKKKKEKSSKGFFSFGKGKSSKESPGGSSGEMAKKDRAKQTLSFSREDRDSSSSPQPHRKLVQTMTGSLDKGLTTSSELTKTLPH